MQVAGLSRSGPALTDIQIRDKVKDVRRIDTEQTKGSAGGLITVEARYLHEFSKSEYSSGNI